MILQKQNIMYIIKNFFFGHNLSINKELNNLVWEFDVYFNRTINNKQFVIETPYHGGQVDGDTLSIFCGINITDDDGNDLFLDIIQSSKKEDYEQEYNVFINQVIDEILLDKEDGLPDYNEFADKFVKFLKETTPEFYFVESSS